MTFAFDIQVAELVEMMSYRRPHGSDTERAFINKYLMPLGLQTDKFGNLWIEIGHNPTTLWSCHTDTVHRKPGRQAVLVDKGIATVAKKKGNNCLGADDTTGCWIMINMIRAQKPGLYIFHRGEECGGLGSTHIAKHEPYLLNGIQRAIAFDRAGYSDVITHQGGQRCCSDTFASALATKLPKGFVPSDQGIFTDTANYVDIIPECTNISVGYARQHGPTEWQDLLFAKDILLSVLAHDFEDLPTLRDPTVVEYSDFYPGWFKNYQPKNPVLDWVLDNPEKAAEIIRMMGYTINELEEF